MNSCFNPLLGRIISRCRCWAAIRLSRHPVPSRHALSAEVDGLDNERQNGQWSTVCSSVPRSQVAEGAMPQLCKQERKRPTPVLRRLSRTHTVGFQLRATKPELKLPLKILWCRVSLDTQTSLRCKWAAIHCSKWRSSSNCEFPIGLCSDLRAWSWILDNDWKSAISGTSGVRC